MNDERRPRAREPREADSLPQGDLLRLGPHFSRELLVANIGRVSQDCIYRIRRSGIEEVTRPDVRVEPAPRNQGGCAPGRGFMDFDSLKLSLLKRLRPQSPQPFSSRE